MIQKLLHNLKKIDNNFESKKYLLAVSGGVDSMVMLHTFQQTDLNFTVAHCNFNLRAEESASDTIFVEEYCKENDINLHVKSFDTIKYASLNKVNIQIAARELRYHWFYDLIRDYRYDYIVTAHHLNDQIETFFINSLRAPGVNGLLGIPEKNDKIIRPYLNITRNEIVSYAQDNNIHWREDSSNASDKYLRNKIRHFIVPILEKMHTDVYTNFDKMFQNLKEDECLKQLYIDDIQKKYCTEVGNQVHIEWEILKKTPQGFLKLKHLLRNYGFNDADEIKKITESKTGKSIIFANYELLKNRENLILRKLDGEDKVSNTIFIEENVEQKNITLIFENRSSSIFLRYKKDIQVDADLLVRPIIARKPIESDYFQPLGMKGRKKISKYLKDIKLSKFDKEEVYVLVNGDNQIIWIIGFQQDDRFKVKSETKNVIKINLK